MNITSDLMIYSAPVAKALKSGAPVVALESTIITHGMPHPQNIDTARAVEQVIRDRGAEPATIAVIEGKLHVGLDDEQLEALARNENVMKLSRADFAYAFSEDKTGSTTVAATMIAARLAGIGVFATGGIGGVHKGAETSFDISADLQELGQTNIVVVCAGAKAILDLDKTLEVLESNGVPVIGFGTNELPAFWSRESGLNAPLRMDTAEAIANHAKMRARLELQGGTLITNPVPAEHEIKADQVAVFITQALQDAEKDGIRGKAVTPFLLTRMFELTDGKSLDTNIALILNNARLAADIAVSMAE